MPPKARQWGSGTVDQVQPGVWRLRVDLGRDERGQRRRASKRVEVKSKRDAEKALRAWAAELERTGAPRRGVLLGGLVDRHVTELERKGRQITTIHNYRGLVARDLPEWARRMPVADVAHTHLEAVYQDMALKGLGPGSIGQMHAILSGALRLAQRAGIVGGNAARLAERPSKVARRQTPPELTQLLQLLAVARAHDNPLALVLTTLAAATGARRGELAALRWSDIDLDAGVLRIERAIRKVTGKPAEKGPTKTRTTREMTIDAGTVEVLRSHRSAQGTHGPWIAPTAFVLASSDDVTCQHPMMPDSLTRLWAEIRGQVPGAGEVRLHDLRHAHATLLLEEGLSIAAVAERLGHSSPLVTSSIYAHGTRVADRRAADTMGRLLAR